jgi:hypothetical protein
MTGSRPIDGGSGYQVDVQHLQGLAKLADRIAEEVQALPSKASQALAVGGQGGLQIGAALTAAESGWSGQFARMAAQASGIGSRLNSNAASYAQTESSVVESMSLRFRGPESAL